MLICAEKLKVERLLTESLSCSKKTADCLRFETLNVFLDETALRSTGGEGYPVKLFGITGQGIRIDVPQSLIAALFAKVDAGEKQIAATASTQ